MTLLAKLIAKEEGFGRAGKLPTVRHNPGDLRHSPHSSHSGIGPNDIGEIPTDAQGWADLERQLWLDASRGLTLGKAIFEWAPAGDGANNPSQYLNDVILGFHQAGHAEIAPTTPLSQVLTIPA